jgi:protein SCO1/2
MADLRKIEKKLSAKARQKVRFAVFSFDSERDTPEKLKTYHQKHKLDGSRWTFYHGDEKSVRELAALLGIQFKKIEGGDFDHSNVISVLDSEGVVVHQQLGSGQSPKQTVAVLEKMIAKKGT